MIYLYSPAEDRATLESDLSADRGAICRGRAASSAPFSAPAEAPKAINSGGLGAGPQKNHIGFSQSSGHFFDFASGSNCSLMICAARREPAVFK